MTTTNTTMTADAILSTLSREARQVIEANNRKKIAEGVAVGLAAETKKLVSSITAQLTGDGTAQKKEKAKSVSKKDKKAEKTDKAKREINRGKTEDGDSYSEWIRKYDSNNPGESGKGLPAKTVLEKAKEQGLEIKSDDGFIHLVYNVRKNVRKGSQKEAAK